MDARFTLYKVGMKFAPAPCLAVPIGTAAATVVGTSPLDDPTAERRRFLAFVTLGEEEFVRRMRELVDLGVYGRFESCVMVLRISAGGTRALAAVVSVDESASSGPAPRVPQPLGTSAAEDTAEVFRAILEGETRQRPVFHATTPDGSTLSGFLAERPMEILEVLGQSSTARAPDPTSSLLVVFAGAAQPVPAGLFVSLPR